MYITVYFKMFVIMLKLELLINYYLNKINNKYIKIIFWGDLFSIKSEIFLRFIDTNVLSD